MRSRSSCRRWPARRRRSRPWSHDGSMRPSCRVGSTWLTIRSCVRWRCCTSNPFICWSRRRSIARSPATSEGCAGRWSTSASAAAEPTYWPRTSWHSPDCGRGSIIPRAPSAMPIWSGSRMDPDCPMRSSPSRPSPRRSLATWSRGIITDSRRCRSARRSRSGLSMRTTLHLLLGRDGRPDRSAARLRRHDSSVRLRDRARRPSRGDPHARHPIAARRPQRCGGDHDPAPARSGLQFPVLPGPPATARCETAGVAAGAALARRHDRVRPPQLSPDRWRRDRRDRERGEHPRGPRGRPVLPDPVAAPAISPTARAELRGVYPSGRRVERRALELSREPTLDLAQLLQLQEDLTQIKAGSPGAVRRRGTRRRGAHVGVPGSRQRRERLPDPTDLASARQSGGPGPGAALGRPRRSGTRRSVNSSTWGRTIESSVAETSSQRLGKNRIPDSEFTIQESSVSDSSGLTSIRNLEFVISNRFFRIGSGTEAGDPAESVLTEDLSQDALGESQALRRTAIVIDPVAAREERPVLVVPSPATTERQRQDRRRGKKNRSRRGCGLDTGSEIPGLDRGRHERSSGRARPCPPRNWDGRRGVSPVDSGRPRRYPGGSRPRVASDNGRASDRGLSGSRP